MSQQPKKVAIIGGGPSGLVAAKCMLHRTYTKAFEPMIFEQSDHIGGLWPPEEGFREGFIDPQMPTNLSKYTCSFSDLAWESVSLRGKSSLEKVPMFPKAWHMGRYIQAYRERFIPEDVIQLKTRVVSATRSASRNGGSWHLQWEKSPDTNAEHPVKNEGYFDFLIMASGFFSKPHHLSGLDVDSFDRRVYHSTDSISWHNAVSDKSLAGKPLIVIGGSISGAEVASSIALKLSSQQYLPNAPAHPRSQVIHICSHPFWTLPQLLPTTSTKTQKSGDDATNGESEEESRPSFLPLDVAMYEVSRRAEDPITTQYGAVPEDNAVVLNGIFSNLLGGDQQDLGNGALQIAGDAQKQPLHLSTSDAYAEFVRDGSIEPLIGSIDFESQSGISPQSLAVHTADGTKKIEDVGCIVDATGFNPSPALGILSREVLEALEINKNCRKMPLVLENSALSHPNIPDLGFVGFYQGPYWGIMEMQARALADQWAQEGRLGKLPPEENASIENMREFRQQVITTPERIPQFVMGDYVGPMESLSQQLRLSRYAFRGQQAKEGPVVPARYLPDPSNPDADALKTIRSTEQLLEASREGNFLVAKAAFRAMQGRWQLRRELKSAISTFPSGTFTGTASFHPRYPTDETYDAEYLYMEEGDFLTSTGMTMKGTRRYVYRYHEKDDKISVWFVKSSSQAENKTVDYLFHKLDFPARKEQEQIDQNHKADQRGWVARGHHLCVEDDYNAEYTFRFKGIALTKFGIEYQVRGPNKDYISTAWYQR